ncbi:hypothetical protein INR49_014197 [Caranx melampygus]|nr:hypothetical protein INR49_014197 [Caranx melampygus]
MAVVKEMRSWTAKGNGRLSLLYQKLMTIPEAPDEKLGNSESGGLICRKPTPPSFFFGLINAAVEPSRHCWVTAGRQMEKIKQSSITNNQLQRQEVVKKQGSIFFILLRFNVCCRHS